MGGQRGKDRERWGAGLLAGAALALFLSGALLRDFWQVYESRRALIALEMLQRGEWLAPRLMGQIILTKPPLLYWLQVLSFHACGVSDHAARLPSVLAGVLGVVALVRLLRRLLDAESALVAGAILTVSPLYFWMAQTAESEILFVVLGVCAMACFGELLARGRPSWGWELGFYLAAGFSFLAKGPLVPLTVLLSVGLWLRFNQKGRPLFRLPLPVGLVLVLLPYLAWFGLLAASGFPVSTIFTELSRHVGEGAKFSESPIFYLRGLGATFFPWSFLLLGGACYGLASGWVRGGKNVDGALAAARGYLARDGGGRRLLLLWFAVTLVVYSVVSSKKFYYALSLLPPGAALCGLLYHDWHDWFRRAGGDGERRRTPLLVALLLVGAGLLTAAALRAPAARGLGQPYSGEQWPGGMILLVWGGAWFLGLAAGQALTRRRLAASLAPRRAAFGWTLASLFVLAASYGLIIHPRLNERQSMKKTTLELKSHLPAGAPLFSLKDNFAVMFYLQRPDAPVLAKPAELRAYAAAHPGAVGVVSGEMENKVAATGAYHVLYCPDARRDKTTPALLFKMDSLFDKSVEKKDKPAKKAKKKKPKKLKAGPNE